VPRHRPWWLGGPVAAAALTLGLSILVLAGLAHLLPSRPRPPAPSELLAAPASEVPDARVPDRKPSLVEAAPKGRAVEAQAEKPGEPSPAELLPPPRRAAFGIVLAPAEEPQDNDTFQRRNCATEEELRQQLAAAEEVGLGQAGASVHGRYVVHVNSPQVAGKGAADCAVLLQLRPDLASLPLRDGPACTLGPKKARDLDTLSRKLRIYLNTLAPAGPNGRPMLVLRQRLRQDLRGKKPEWLRGEAVPTLTQMLMADDVATRRLLVELLAAIPQEPATLALAQRAAFDLDAGVRAAAVEALAGRDPEVSRPVLLKALRYPWPPPADFAAEALVHLDDKGAVAELVVMLGEPRPGRPYVTPDRRVVIREVVKINHLANCLLCHPPALRGNEPVLGVDPVQSIPTPTSRNRGLAQAGRSFAPSAGGHNYGNRPTTPGSTPSTPVMIRGDITFLRQDFSVGFPLPPPAQQVPQLERIAQGNPVLDRAIRTPPSPVRFDFVVRTRHLGKSERMKWQKLQEKSDPHRDAALFALRGLTHQDRGDRTEEWERAFPLAKAEVRSNKLTERLVRAEPLPRAGLLQQYRDGAGVEYTWALTRAIPRLSGVPQEVARLALVNRLAKLPVNQLRQYLSDRNPEVCRAAVRACAQKDDRSLVEDLIPLLSADALTAHLASETLTKLTGQDLPDASAWRIWWNNGARAGN
jgi:hypothetical protein